MREHGRGKGAVRGNVWMTGSRAARRDKGAACRGGGWWMRDGGAPAWLMINEAAFISPASEGVKSKNLGNQHGQHGAAAAVRQRETYST